MLPETDDAAVQADAYIDALLAGHGRTPMAVVADEGANGPLGRQPGVRDAIRLLDNGLPRFHPSFVFEEWLSRQLQSAAAVEGRSEGGERPPAEIVQIVIRPEDTGTRSTGARSSGAPADRRLLVGGAIASGVSIAGAAVIAWRRTARSRHVPGGAD